MHTFKPLLQIRDILGTFKIFLEFFLKYFLCLVYEYISKMH